MSDDLSCRSAAEAERLDRVIDEVARQMTEGVLPNDFRARVVALATNPEARSPNHVGRWVFAPLAAAALVVLAIVGARFVGRRAESPAPQIATTRRAESPGPQAAAPPAPNVAQHVPSLPNVAQPFRAARPFAPTRAADRFSDIDALAPLPLVAPSIGIDTLTTASIALEQLETIAPITVAPLPAPEGDRP